MHDTVVTLLWLLSCAASFLNVGGNHEITEFSSLDLQKG